jgi:hypothetical protein
MVLRRRRPASLPFPLEITMNQNLAALTDEQVKAMFPGATEAGFNTKEMQALLQIVDAVAEAIRDLTAESPMKGVPSGHLYAMLMSMMNLQMYQTIVGLLKKAGLVKESGHFLTWVAPAGWTHVETDTPQDGR